MMQIIDCKAIRDEILSNIRIAAAERQSIIAISKEWSGDDISYLRSITKTAKLFGVEVQHVICGYDPTAADLSEIVKRATWRNEGKTPAVLLLGFTPEERERIARRPDGMLMLCKLLDPPYCPNVIEAVERVLFKTMGDRITEPIHTVVIGRSELATKAGTRLLKKGHTVTFVHTGTDDLKAYTRKADVIVSFAGRPNLIKGDMVKDGAVIVSVGCGTLEGRLCGDIDMDSMKGRNVLVTPTPGGVGIITTALLFEDLAR